MRSEDFDRKFDDKESLSFIGILAIVTWTAHFWHFGGLGLYEDDYFYVGEPIRMNLIEFFDFIKRINLYFFQFFQFCFWLGFVIIVSL